MLKHAKKCLLATSLIASTSASATVLEIALLIDGSGSIGSSDYQLQLDGYRNTFASGSFYTDYIASSNYDSVYFAAWQFSDSIRLEADWTEIDSDASANTFGNLFNTAEMTQIGSLTNTGGAINTAMSSLLGNGYGGGVNDTMIIDISTDGVPTSGPDPYLAADLARSDEITINAIGVGGGVNSAFLEDIVGIGSGSDYTGFYELAVDFDAFGDAIQAKIGREVRGDDDPDPVDISEPTSLAVFGFGALALGAFRRRKVLVK